MSLACTLYISWDTFKRIIVSLQNRVELDFFILNHDYKAMLIGAVA